MAYDLTSSFTLTPALRPALGLFHLVSKLFIPYLRGFPVTGMPLPLLLGLSLNVSFSEMPSLVTVAKHAVLHLDLHSLILIPS